MKRVLRGVAFVGLLAVMALIAASQAALRAVQRASSNRTGRRR